MAALAFSHAKLFAAGAAFAAPFAALAFWRKFPRQTLSQRPPMHLLLRRAFLSLWRAAVTPARPMILSARGGDAQKEQR